MIFSRKFKNWKNSWNCQQNHRLQDSPESTGWVKSDLVASRICLLQLNTKTVCSWGSGSWERFFPLLPREQIFPQLIELHLGNEGALRLVMEVERTVAGALQSSFWVWFKGTSGPGLDEPRRATLQTLRSESSSEKWLLGLKCVYFFHLNNCNGDVICLHASSYLSL